MPELRWILFALGVLFCVGLWWWETRRQRRAADSPMNQASIHDSTEAGDAPGHVGWAESSKPNTPDAWNVGLRRLSPTYAAAERIEPTVGETTIEESSHAIGEASEPSPPPPVKEEKIVTVRVVAAPSTRFDGIGLVDALRAAGMEHGKFSIFHRTTEEGRTLFSVASMVKPGSFDLDNLGGRQYPGVVLFAVLEPGAQDGGSDVVDLMLSTAEQLARQLNGVLQDDRGAPLTLQRLATLRAEIADWRRLPA